MANTVLIMGQSGTGKSTSITTLDSSETFIINVIDKPLPFRGFKKKYIPCADKAMVGNYCATDRFELITRIIKIVNENRPDIKNLIIDDFQYIMCNEFMRRSKERGYDKFTEIGHNAWSILRDLGACREDLDCFVMSHSELDNDGRYKFKTIGKMLDDKITVEGMFTIVFHTTIIDGKYKFITENDGVHIAKSPRGMFESKYIDNDLQGVKKLMNEYYEDSLIDIL